VSSKESKDLRQVRPPDLWPEIDRRITAQRPAPMRNGARVAVRFGVAALFVAAAVVAAIVLHGSSSASKDPVPPAGQGPLQGFQLHAKTWVVQEKDARALIKREGGPGPRHWVFLPKHVEVVVARLDWTPQQLNGKRLLVVVIDQASQSASTYIQVVPRIAVIALGWAGAYDNLDETYAWLAPTAPVDLGGGGSYLDVTGAYLRTSAGGRVWMVASFSPRTISPNPSEPPIVGAILVDQNDHVLWAIQVPQDR
jgi:hypothetical protein